MKRILRSKILIALLFAVAVVLVGIGSIGGTRAVLSAESEIYESQLALSDIGVSLTENGNIISRRDYVQRSDGLWSGNTGVLIENLVKDAGDNAFKLGKRYPVSFGVKNTGTIPQFVRVTIYRYWIDPQGEKRAFGWTDGNGPKKLDLDPRLIEVSLTDNGLWTAGDAPSKSGERIVLYYKGNEGILQPGEEAQFADAIRVSADVPRTVKAQTSTQTEGGKTRTVYSYAYDDIAFVLDIQVDAVQTHSADKARISAWGQTGEVQR